MTAAFFTFFTADDPENILKKLSLEKYQPIFEEQEVNQGSDKNKNINNNLFWEVRNRIHWPNHKIHLPCETKTVSTCP